jgi:SHS2 domain-containing protein
VGRWEFLDAVALADCAVEIEGEDPADLFETAARAVAELMVDPATVPAAVERSLDLAAPQLDLLLYDWLSELIFRKDRDREIFPDVRVTVSGSGPFHLAARLRGGPIEPGRTELRADAKAVTLHQFAVERVGARWRARVVIDI